jgi:hypothetical protein
MFIILLDTLRAYFSLLRATDFNSVLPLRNERQFQTIRHHEHIFRRSRNAYDFIISEHNKAISRLMSDKLSNSRTQAIISRIFFLESLS